MNDKSQQDFDILNRLQKVIEARKGADPKSSYSASLLSKGVSHCARKFGEEAIETVIAGAGEDDAALIAESADALYHLMVLLSVRGLNLQNVVKELERREGTSGHDEKAGR